VEVAERQEGGAPPPGPNRRVREIHGHRETVSGGSGEQAGVRREILLWDQRHVGHKHTRVGAQDFRVGVREAREM
jgi:hypothetical protein